MKIISVLDQKIGSDHLAVIAGPCVIEEWDIISEIVKNMKKITSDLGLSYIFKASFDKANRTSVKSFRGPGLDKGLKILMRVKEEFNVPVISDIHEISQIDKAKDVLDIIQIPAFLSRQTNLLIAAGMTGKPVNVKKGQFLAPSDMAHVIAKIESTGNNQICLTERGSSFGYNNLVVDFRGMSIMSEFGYPVIFDATHSVQLPGGCGISSGGDRDFVPVLTRAAVGAGVDGLFMEVHPEPDKAMCDAPNSLALDSVSSLLTQCKAIFEVTRER